MTQSKSAFLYRVLVNDKLAQTGGTSHSTREYATESEAISSAQKIIDDQIVADLKRNPDDRPLMLLDGFLDFGFVPTVVCPDLSIAFNIRAYAERRCYELKGLPVPEKLVWRGPNLG